MNNNNNNNQHIIKKNTSVDYKYICIKKDVFDSSMIYLNNSSLQKNKYIEIIYKSPSVFLEGLFFKTPPIALKDIIVYYKESKSYNNYHQSNYQSNPQTNQNPTIKLLLNYKDHTQFINILRTIDEHISTYINKYSVEIENDLLNYYNDNRPLSSFNYEQIIKFRKNSGNSNNNTIEIHMKSYLDNVIIDMLDNKLDNKLDDKKYIFTFNISNIYFSNNNNLLPLVKCNRCETV
jgi:hypothetical protein